MWNILEDNYLCSLRLYFEKIMFINHKHTFIFSTDINNMYLYIIINGSVHTCRLIDNFHSSFYDDKYITKKDINHVFSKFNVCYTVESEYLDWFKKNSFIDSNDEELYHFYVNSEDYVVEFITDEKPKIEVVKINTGDGTKPLKKND